MLSYYHQPSTTQCVYKTIPDKIKEHAEADPDKVALVMCHRKCRRYEIMRNEIYEQSTKFALTLLKLGIKKGERIAYCSHNRIDWLCYDVGIMKAGCIPVHFRFGALDIKAVLADCDIVVLEAKRSWEDFLTIAKIGPGGLVDCPQYPELRLAIAINLETLPNKNVLLSEDLMEEFDPYSPDNKFPYIDPEDTAFISHVPAKVDIPARLNRHSHFSSINCPSFLSDGSDYHEDDVRFSSGSMADTSNYPFGYIQKGCKCVNGDQVYLNDPRSFDTLVDIWRTEACTIISMIPDSVTKLKDLGFRVPVISAVSEVLTKEMLENCFQFADEVVMVNDNPEALRIAHKVFTKDNLNEYQKGMFGRASEGVEIKIVNNELDTVPLGEIGKICVRSQWSTKTKEGYTGLPIEHGWFQTTFIGHMLPNGDVILKK